MISKFHAPERPRRLGRKRVIKRAIFCTCRLPWNIHNSENGPLVQCQMCKECMASPSVHENIRHSGLGLGLGLGGWEDLLDELAPTLLQLTAYQVGQSPFDCQARCALILAAVRRQLPPLPLWWLRPWHVLLLLCCSLTIYIIIILDHRKS